MLKSELEEKLRNTSLSNVRLMGELGELKDKYNNLMYSFGIERDRLLLQLTAKNGTIDRLNALTEAVKAKVGVIDIDCEQLIRDNDTNRLTLSDIVDNTDKYKVKRINIILDVLEKEDTDTLGANKIIDLISKVIKE